MDKLEIEGGVPLKGSIVVSGAKNAALPLMAAGLAGEGTLTLTNVPKLVDTKSMEELLTNHGLEVKRSGEKVVMRGEASHYDAPYDLVRKMRASILVLGPLLARYGRARVSHPGGCAIGTRPIDLHISAMMALGAVVELADGYIQARAAGGAEGGAYRLSHGLGGRDGERTHGGVSCQGRERVGQCGARARDHQSGRVPERHGRAHHRPRH